MDFSLKPSMRDTEVQKTFLGCFPCNCHVFSVFLCILLSVVLLPSKKFCHTPASACFRASNSSSFRDSPLSHSFSNLAAKIGRVVVLFNKVSTLKTFCQKIWLLNGCSLWLSTLFLYDAVNLFLYDVFRILCLFIFFVA